MNNGSLSYPSLPKRIDRLNADISLKNTTQSSAFTNVVINSLDVASAGNFVKALGNVKNQSDAYDVDIDSDFEINLNDIKECIPLEPGTELTGILDGKLAINTSVNNSLGFIASGSELFDVDIICLLYTSPSPRDLSTSRMPSSA